MPKEISTEFDSLLFDSLSDLSENTFLFLANMKTNYYRWSKNAVEYFGLPGEIMYDVPSVWIKYIHPDDRHFFTDDFQRITDGVSDNHHCQYRVINRYGVYVWLQCKGKVKRDQDGNLESFAGMITNLGPKSRFDATTNLLSIHSFRAELEDLCDKGGEDGYVMILGIDRFKRINDLYTFSFGDQVLCSLAQKLLSLCPPGARVYKMDGDKFSVIYQGASREDVERLYKKLQKTAEFAWQGDGKAVSVSISAGAAAFKRGEARADILHRNADYALEVSKESGKNRLSFFADDMLKRSLRKFALMEHLKESIRNDFKGFSLHYQPIIDGENGKLKGCEALLRYHCEGFPATSPAEFIPLLEDSGSICEVGRWVLSTAIRQAKIWRETLPDFLVSVNVSYIQLKDPEFKKFVKEELKRYEYPAPNLILELTESCKVVEFKRIRDEMENFRMVGIKVALDDFGTGYASISVLRELPTDIVKLDHSFVGNVKERGNDNIIIKHLIGMCHSLGIRVCIEGIEDKQIYDIVSEYQPNSFQGYYFSRPIPAEEFTKQFI